MKYKQIFFQVVFLTTFSVLICTPTIKAQSDDSDPIKIILVDSPEYKNMEGRYNITITFANKFTLEESEQIVKLLKKQRDQILSDCKLTDTCFQRNPQFKVQGYMVSYESTSRNYEAIAKEVMRIVDPGATYWVMVNGRTKTKKLHDPK